MSDALLAWYFVIVWGSGYLATKLGLRYAAPFTFLTLRFAFGVACMLVLLLRLLLVRFGVGLAMQPGC